MDFFTFLGIFFAVWIVLKMIAGHVTQRVELENLKQRIGEKIRVVRLEEPSELGDLILAYDQENDQYLGQGTNYDEVKQRIIDRFPDRIFLLNGEPFSKITLKLPQ
jgi:hypothetical protein